MQMLYSQPNVIDPLIPTNTLHGFLLQNFCNFVFKHLIDFDSVTAYAKENLTHIF